MGMKHDGVAGLTRRLKVRAWNFLVTYFWLTLTLLLRKVKKPAMIIDGDEKKGNDKKRLIIREVRRAQ